jgi:hypothetical protein
LIPAWCSYEGGKEECWWNKNRIASWENEHEDGMKGVRKSIREWKIKTGRAG